MKIGLLGGSFDPIHDGHLLIAKTALKALELDEIWLIPVLNNPFKDREMASGEDRCEMIRLACRKYDQMKICDIELKGDPAKKSYTYDTLVKLKDLYPNDDFYYIIGDDQVAKFNDWYQASDIAKMVQLICFARKGYVTSQKNIKAYNMQRIDYKPVKISSTEIREGHLKHIDKKVVEYFTMHGLYLDSIVSNYMSPKRFTHTKSMALLSRDIAKENGLDENKAYVAGMLHDIAKEMDEKRAEKLMKKHYAKHYEMPRAVWHQWLSCYVAKKEFHIHDKEILQAIKNHTTGSLDMSLLDMTIYCADKLDPSRGYDSSSDIALCKQDIVAGFKKSLTDFEIFSKRKNRPIDPIFYEIYKKYVEEQNG